MHYYVYIHQTPNNKFYVGITTQTPKKRWNNGHGYRSNKHFYNAILKYGWNNISHVVIEVYSKEWMYELEQILISLLHSNIPEYGYNNSIGGEKGGLKYTTEEERETALNHAILKSRKKYYNTHKEERKLSQQQYYEDHREVSKKYYEDHREEIISHYQQYYEEHRENILRYHQQQWQKYYNENKEKRLAYYREHRKMKKTQQQNHK
jgi:predicted GIY-YIG superfamily endonuclease